MFKSGKYKQQIEYKSFTPSFINQEYILDESISLLLEEASRCLGELNAYATLVPDVNFFIKMHIKKEATTSSRIEGTMTGIDEAVLPEDEVSPEEKDDWIEVHNYVLAMDEAIKNLDNLPLSMRLICNTHKRLLSGVRGASKLPGEIRVSQNWIGGSNLKNAFFIPPHQDDLPALLTDFEKFWHSKKSTLPILIKIAISHYQFETIHPFLDGNGRMGRLLIILQLIDSSILKTPCLYLSDFFEKNKGSYYDSLTMVRSSNDLDQWIKFFLSGVIETSKNGRDTLQSIVHLKEKYMEKIMTLKGSSESRKRLLDLFFSYPIMSPSLASRGLEMSYPQANRLLRKLQELGLLKEKTGYSRNRLFVLDEYLKLFK